MAIGLRLLLYRTRIGIAMRAVVDDRSLAQLNGARTGARRPHQLGHRHVAGRARRHPRSCRRPGSARRRCRCSSSTPTPPRSSVGSARLPLTFVGAIVLGLIEGYLIGYLPQNQYLPGLRLAAPVILLFIVLLLIPNPQPAQPRPHPGVLPGADPHGRGDVRASFTLAFGAVLATTLSRSDLTTYAKIFSIGIVALSLVPLVGFAGQISLCQLSFAGIGAV